MITRHPFHLYVLKPISGTEEKRLNVIAKMPLWLLYRNYKNFKYGQRPSIYFYYK